MSDSYDKGGYIPGPPIPVTLEPDECLINQHMECVRADHTHDPAEAVVRRADLIVMMEQMRIGPPEKEVNP